MDNFIITLEKLPIFHQFLVSKRIIWNKIALMRIGRGNIGNFFRTENVGKIR